MQIRTFKKQINDQKAALANTISKENELYFALEILSKIIFPKNDKIKAKLTNTSINHKKKERIQAPFERSMEKGTKSMKYAPTETSSSHKK